MMEWGTLCNVMNMHTVPSSSLAVSGLRFQLCDVVVGICFHGVLSHTFVCDEWGKNTTLR